MTTPTADSTRDRLLELLRPRPSTVEELASRLQLTANGVRAQLAMLERDGLVRREGVRHTPGAGKPPQVYVITRQAEEGFSRAWPPALTALTTILARRLPARERMAVFRAAGRHLATAVPADTRVPAAEQAKRVLESLGASVTSQAGPDGVSLLAGTACPLASAVAACADTCEMVRALLADCTGASVTTRCDHGTAPRCRFAVGKRPTQRA